jgi:predicted amidohydrolase
MKTRVVLGQISPSLGDVDRNLRIHLEEIRRAERARADLIVFPELSLTGYLLQDLVTECAQTPGASPALEALARASRTVGVVAGFVERGAGGALYNAAACYAGGALVHRHRKVYLPTYGMFDEARYVGSGEMFRTFDAKWGRTGILICEDFWHLSTSWLLAQQGLDVLVVVSCSPTKAVSAAAQPPSHTAWVSLAQVVAQFLGCFVVYVNRTGYEEGWNFSGGSFAAAPDGRIVARSKLLKPDRVVATLEGAVLRTARLTSPLLRDEKLDLVRRELDRIAAARYAAGS